VGDPNIPNGETAYYRVTVGNETYPLVQRTVRKTEGGREIYEVTSESRAEDNVVRMDCRGMNVYYAFQRTKKTDFTLETRTDVVKNQTASKADELVLVTIQGIDQVLRGFPFGRLQTMKVRLAQSAEFSFVVNLTKEVDITTLRGTVKCYELELALDGFFGGFMPKTYLWYSKDAPHYLVKYQGSRGGPGSTTMTIELSGYEVK
jgi:hypothetical protein